MTEKTLTLTDGALRLLDAMLRADQEQIASLFRADDRPTLTEGEQAGLQNLREQVARELDDGDMTYTVRRMALADGTALVGVLSRSLRPGSAGRVVIMRPFGPSSPPGAAVFAAEGGHWPILSDHEVSVGFGQTNLRNAMYGIALTLNQATDDGSTPGIPAHIQHILDHCEPLTAEYLKTVLHQDSEIHGWADVARLLEARIDELREMIDADGGEDWMNEEIDALVIDLDAIPG